MTERKSSRARWYQNFQEAGGVHALGTALVERRREKETNL